MFPAITDGDFHVARLRESHAVKAREILLENFFQFFVPTPERIELYQHGAVRRMKVADALDGFCLEKAQQLSDSFVSVKCDLIGEVDQERLIARALESPMADCKGKHAGKSIPPDSHHPNLSPSAAASPIRRKLKQKPHLSGGREAGRSIVSFFIFAV